MLKGTDNHRSRLVVAAILNAALAIYVLLRIDHLRDIRDYRYATASSPWIYAVVAVPTVALLILIPVLRSHSRFQQWLAIGLSFLPGFFALMGWWQILEIWIGERQQKMHLTSRQLQFRCAVGFALNAALWMAQPKLMRETGDFFTDVVPVTLIALLAGAAAIPGVALTKEGNLWQKALGLIFMPLPLWSLGLISYWAVSKW